MSADSGTTTKLFAKEDHAAIYAQARPDWPPEIIEKSVSFLCEKKSGPFTLAVDVGCGTGQNTRPLASHFEKVIGFDVSEAQIAAARTLENPQNVEFGVSGAESVPVPNCSVDIVTAATAVHWFELDAFFGEVDRILKPGGCVAIYTYGHILPWVEGDNQLRNQLLKDVVSKLYKFLKPYINDRIHIVENKLADVHIPYPETIRDDTLEIKRDATVASFINYLRSWSFYRRYRESNPHTPDPILDVQNQLMEILGFDCAPEHAQMSTKAPVVMLLGRKPDNQPGN